MQRNPNLTRHDDPCDEWQSIGDYVRKVRERAEQDRRNLAEFYDAASAYDDEDFAMNFVRFAQ